MSFKIGDYVVVKCIDVSVNESTLKYCEICIGYVAKIKNIVFENPKYPYFLDFLDKNINMKLDDFRWNDKELRKATKKEICFEEL